MPTPLQSATIAPAPCNSLTASAGATAIALVRTQDAIWYVRSGWQDKLFGDGSPDWLRLTPGAGVEQVKLASGRSTFVVRLDSGGVFAKLYSAQNWLSKFRHKIRGGPALIEWRNLRIAEDRAIPCVIPLALGVTPLALGRSVRDAGRQVLLTREAEGTRTLHDICLRERNAQRSLTPALDRMHLAAVAKLLATSHERGFVHRDGHPGNILVGPAPDGGVGAQYVDCYAVDIRRGRVPTGRRVRALAQLDLFLRHCLTRSQRLRFLREYNRQCVALGASAEPVAVSRALVDRIAALQERMTQKLAGTRDRRLRRNGPYFQRINPAPNWSGVVVLKLARRHLFPERGVPDRTLEQWQSMLPAMLEQLVLRQPSVCGFGRSDQSRARKEAGDNRTRKNRREETPGSSPPPSARIESDGLVLEIIRPVDKWQALQWRWRGSEAKRVFERCHRARHQNRPSELILGYLEYRDGPRIEQAVVIRPAPSGGPDGNGGG